MWFYKSTYLTFAIIFIWFSWRNLLMMIASDLCFLLDQTCHILSIASIFLVALLNVIYYTAIYKRDDVFIGYGISEAQYQKFQKKYYLFKVLLESAILLALYAYFMCVITTYKNALRQEKAKAMEDDAAAAKGDDKWKEWKTETLVIVKRTTK